MLRFNELFFSGILFLLAVGLIGSNAFAQTNVPPECSVRSVGVHSALRNGAQRQRALITQISDTIIRNAGGDRQIVRLVSGPFRRQADRALEQTFRAIAAFPTQVIICVEPTECTQQSLDAERARIISTSRRIAEVATRLVNRFPNLLGEPAIFVQERIESRFNAFLDGIDFLPPYTYECPFDSEQVAGSNADVTPAQSPSATCPASGAI